MYAVPNAKLLRPRGSIDEQDVLIVASLPDTRNLEHLCRSIASNSWENTERQARDASAALWKAVSRDLELSRDLLRWI